jgi:hypothetical protein
VFPEGPSRMTDVSATLKPDIPFTLQEYACAIIIQKNIVSLALAYCIFSNVQKG